MKFHEFVFVTVCAAICAAMIWAASRLDEPFFICSCAFLAAFWGALAGLAVWGRISANEEAQRRRDYQPTIIWPHGRRPC